MFVNRRAELQLLEERYATGRPELFVLYGRRRVGKTELLTEFCRGKRHVFFVADLNTEPVLRASFSDAVNAALSGPEAPAAVYRSWEDVFAVLAHAARDERLVVVLDEFTYLISAHPPLASMLQRLWDTLFRGGRLMLILCGSYIGMMEQDVLGYRAPLYGRRTGQYLLEPLGFRDACEFFPDYGAVDRVRAYAVFGGTPGYLRNVSAERPLTANIGGQVLARGSFLYDEARFLLQQELREPRNYFAVLEAIASGRTRLNEIKQATGLEGVSAYLDTLQSLRLVERVVPVTEQQPHKSRRGLYRLCDYFFRFWFRFVHPNRTALEQGGGRVVLDRVVVPQLDALTGPVFEEVCRQFLWRQGMAGRLPLMPLRMGSWWRANEEIDVVALDDEAALLVECKWTARPVGIDVLHDLERKAQLIRGDLGDRHLLRLGFCARAGFTPALQREATRRDDVLLFDLDQIVAR